MALGLHCCGSGGSSSLWYVGSHCGGFSCDKAQASRAQAQWLWCTGLVALRHVESFRTRDRTRGPLHWQVDSLPLDHQGSLHLTLTHILLGLPT